MFFTECARIAKKHPDLAGVLERLDSQLREIGTAEVIRSADLASLLRIDPNQMRSALDMFAQEGVLRRVEMIECPYCEMAALPSDYQEALEEDDEYRCTSCDRPLTNETVQIITAYRRGERWQGVSDPRDGSEVTGLREASPLGIPPNHKLDEQASYTHATVERKAVLEAYKNEGRAKKIKITDKMVAEAASRTWHDRTPVQRWKRNDPRCTPADDAKIRRVLREKPHLR